ncbi:hypothetical protein P171DRAFT_428917 [Karstenula rhodostoma CBS 690.94]|uniref:Uncharacterized protein n=1 Tax=Karstenula rhodostoma CBS 690.94 TaxID=1392251 RepID=A0A9P4PRI9_9PLEO|nr:hypothetical protein P171DRAFT_428917 [Karstenula rhodostoma CBS 690.94]
MQSIHRLHLRTHLRSLATQRIRRHSNVLTIDTNLLPRFVRQPASNSVVRYTPFTQPQYVHALASCAHFCKYENSALYDMLNSFLPEHGSVPAGGSAVSGSRSTTCIMQQYISSVPEEETLAAEAECSIAWAFPSRTRGGCSDRCGELLTLAHLTTNLKLKTICKYNKISMFAMCPGWRRTG